MCWSPLDDNDYDYIRVNESDGMTFYGYEDDEGRITWYMEDGACDSVT